MTDSRDTECRLITWGAGEYRAAAFARELAAAAEPRPALERPFLSRGEWRERPRWTGMQRKADKRG